MERAGLARGHGRAQSRKKAQGACRPRRVKKGELADGFVPRGQPNHRDHVKVFRRRSWNAAEAEARESNVPQDLAEQANQAEQRELHRRQDWRMHRHSSKSSADSQHGNPVTSQIPRVVGQKGLRRKVMSKRLHDSASARLHLWEPVNRDSLGEVRPLG